MQEPDIVLSALIEGNPVDGPLIGAVGVGDAVIVEGPVTVMPVMAGATAGAGG